MLRPPLSKTSTPIDILLEHDANIALGDWNDSEGLEIEKALGSRCLFRKCDVSKFDDVLELFQAAWLKFGSVNAVLSNAGVNTNEGLLVDEYDEKTGKLLPPSYKSIEINLYGQINVVKCAMHYFAKDSTPAQIVMTASAAAFLPAPPIHLYCAAKSGVLGLMRALRPDMESRNTTINVVCPWMTRESLGTRVYEKPTNRWQSHQWSCPVGKLHGATCL